jgi:hypothetical protein
VLICQYARFAAISSAGVSQRPLKRAYEQKPERVQQWMTEASPAIAERAKAEGAGVQWGDETAKGVRR